MAFWPIAAVSCSCPEQGDLPRRAGLPKPWIRRARGDRFHDGTCAKERFSAERCPGTRAWTRSRSTTPAAAQFGWDTRRAVGRFKCDCAKSLLAATLASSTFWSPAALAYQVIGELRRWTIRSAETGGPFRVDRHLARQRYIYWLIGGISAPGWGHLIDALR